MKKMKKIIALALSLVMLMAMGMTAFAGELEGGGVETALGCHLNNRLEGVGGSAAHRKGAAALPGLLYPAQSARRGGRWRRTPPRKRAP